VVDLREVPFVDSAALEYLLGLQEALSERLGQVKLSGADATVAKILEITRLENAFESYPDATEAVRAP
jgi:anti-anti-sigma factor